MKAQRVLGLLLVGLVGPIGATHAIPVFNNTGITSPAATITFDEQVFAAGRLITYQYSADGVRFAPSLVYGVPVAPGQFPLIDGNLLRNFFPNNDFSSVNGTSPFSLKFEDVQTRAAAAINMVPGNGQATALLNGVVVESFSFTAGPAGESRYVGFENVAFDEIRIDAPGSSQTVLLDNVLLGLASTSIRNRTGLTQPVRTITFDEHVFAPGTVLVDQYADQGVRFSPNIVYGVPVAPGLFPPLEGAVVRNFWPNQDTSLPFVGEDPFSLLFDQDQTAVAFALNFLAPGAATITALLDGLAVRKFEVEASTDSTDNFFLGFSGIVFDEIRIDLPDANNTILLDNIQFGPAAAAPEPGSLVLVGLGLAGLAWTRRRRCG